MIDIQRILQEPKTFDEHLKTHQVGISSSDIISLENKRKNLISIIQSMQEERNVLSKEKTQNFDTIEKSKKLRIDIHENERELRIAEETLKTFLLLIPNVPEFDVPEGSNSKLYDWGVRRNFNFTPKEHFEIGEKLNQMDFEVARKISGSRFVFLKNDLALLERALGQYMLDVHTRENEYTEVSPSLLVRPEALYGTSQLPKFEDDLFKTTSGYYLIPTAEVSLTNMVREQILDEEELPLRFVALTHCFRSEAGAAGKDTKGMIRQHQFQKVELVSIVTPKDSRYEHRRMAYCIESILKGLDLPFRVISLGTSDIGFSSQKTYDFEVWLPGQKDYREISSCSNCGDFQSRRMNARYRSKVEKGTKLLHTLNGSGVAVGRALIAVLENYQNSDGSVSIPKVLQPYMNNQTKIMGR